MSQGGSGIIKFARDSEQTETLQEFLRFIIVGVGSTGLNFIIYAVCVSLGMSPAGAAALAFVILIPFHFKAYSSFVFKSNRDIAGALRYGLVLAVSMVLNVGLVTFFWAYLLADPLPAQALGLAPAIAANYLLLRYFAFPRARQPNRKSATPWAWFAIAGVSALAIYVSVAAMLIYTNPLLFADDWRHYTHYFFQRDVIDAIFGRENNHLMVIPNLIFLSNYQFLDGRMSNLALANVGLLLAASVLLATGWIKATWRRERSWVEVLGIVFTWGAVTLFLGAPRTLFWGIGVHNHLVVLGVVGAALFASGIAGSLTRPGPFAGFVSSAAVAATSFTTGAAAWLLAFPGAVANREKPIVLLAAMGIGLIGLTATVWPILNGGDSTRYEFDPVSLATFSIAMFGSAWSAFGQSGLSDNIFQNSLIAGALGTLVVAAAAIRVLLPRPIGTIGQLYCFFMLIGLFVVVAGLMIGIGRIGPEDGLDKALSPRFRTWSLLGWTSVAGITLAAAYEAGQRLRVEWMFGTYALLLVFFLLLVNLKVIDTSLRFSHAYHVDTMTQVAMNHTTRPTERRLWRDQEDVWLRIIRHLREFKRSIYAEAWPHRMGHNLSTILDQLDEPCASQLRVIPSNRSDEWTVRGWILPRSPHSAPISNVYFLDDANIVIGFAKPVFGWASNPQSRYWEHATAPARLMNSIGIRGLGNLPGISGHFLGRFLASTTDASKIKQELRFVGETRRGWQCRGSGRDSESDRR